MAITEKIHAILSRLISVFKHINTTSLTTGEAVTFGWSVRHSIMRGSALVISISLKNTQTSFGSTG